MTWWIHLYWKREGVNYFEVKVRTQLPWSEYKLNFNEDELIPIIINWDASMGEMP